MGRGFESHSPSLLGRVRKTSPFFRSNLGLGRDGGPAAATSEEGAVGERATTSPPRGQPFSPSTAWTCSKTSWDTKGRYWPGYHLPLPRGGARTPRGPRGRPAAFGKDPIFFDTPAPGLKAGYRLIKTDVSVSTS